MDPELFPVYVKQKLEQTRTACNQISVRHHLYGRKLFFCRELAGGNAAVRLRWKSRQCLYLKPDFEAAWREISEKGEEIQD